MKDAYSDTVCHVKGIQLAYQFTKKCDSPLGTLAEAVRSWTGGSPQTSPESGPQLPLQFDECARLTERIHHLLLLSIVTQVWKHYLNINISGILFKPICQMCCFRFSLEFKQKHKYSVCHWCQELCSVSFKDVWESS